MTSVRLATDAGVATLHIQFDDHRRVLAAHGLIETAGELSFVLEWLCAWLPGREITRAQELACEALLAHDPRWGLEEARFVDALLRDVVYQTHRQVKVFGALLCACHKVDRQVVRDFIRDNPDADRAQVSRELKAGSGCGKCVADIEVLLADALPLQKRWQGEPNSSWILKLEESLALWKERKQDYPALHVASFRAGVVKLHVAGALTADQEWDLVKELGDYWAEGFPAGLSVFLDFSLAHAAK
ncbi:MAG: (2Fe-2S)-binding protein [Bacteriovoracia bacterium]